MDLKISTDRLSYYQETWQRFASTAWQGRVLASSKILACSAIALSVLVGCTDTPEVTVHRVPKERSGLAELRATTGVDRPVLTPPQASPMAQPTRMVVAIFEQPQETWFAKVTGPPEQIKATTETWTKFFNSIQFANGQATWDAPKEWKQSAPRPMREATYLVPETSPPLEVVVSKLPGKQSLLLNANRWLGQINLPPTTADNVDEYFTSQSNTAGTYLLFDQTGSGSGQMSPPFAGNNRSGNAPAAPFASGAENAPPKLTFETPAGWNKVETSGIVSGRLNKIDGDAKAQITLIDLPASANEWGPNALRWAGQVGLESLTEEQLAERTSEITVDGVTGKLIDLIDNDSNGTDGMLAGMVKHKGSAWFLKIMGDKQLVDQSRDEFLQLLDSIRFQ